VKVIDLKALGKNRISFYLALEEYLLGDLTEDLFFLWDIPSSIVIGRNQLLYGEVNLPFVRAHNIPVYRRPSGGGAIFADENCFMYSFLSREYNRETLNQKFLSKLSEALKNLGLDITFSGRNDLLFMGKKFSGTAILQTPKGSILHGTFLYDTDIAMLVEALTVDPDKIISKGIKSVSERVINLKPYLKLSKYELMDYLNNFFADSFYRLTEEELLRVRQIEQKYLDPAWIEGKKPPFTVKTSRRFPYGKIEVFVNVRKNLIESLTIAGDFFEKRPIGEFTEHFRNIPFSETAVSEVLDKVSFGDFIEGSTNDDIRSLLSEGGINSEKNSSL